MSTICQRFAQNAWKKDLCSNCFKSKEEHKAANADVKPIKFPSTRVPDAPAKGIMKLLGKTKRKHKVSFPKDVAQVIGFGGDWSDLDAESDSEAEATTTNKSPTADEITKEIDELEQELVKLTKVNTNYNQSNGNLLGDAEANIKRSFAALQLGSGNKDAEGKKQTLKISVMPFGGPVTTNKVNDIKQKFSGGGATTNETDAAATTKPPVVLKTIIKAAGAVEYIEEPTLEALLTPIAIAVPPEKSLMDEISETLEKKNKEKQENKIKLEINSIKRSLQRHAPIVKDQAKPKISVFPKTSDTDSNQSDTENSSSGYYDVVEASTRYENISDDFGRRRDSARSDDIACEIRNKNESSFFSNHLISEMFSSNKDRKNSYSFMSEITSDGLIVTKASSDDAMDSTGSSFDYATSSDEELSSMNRSESDSGIGICVTTSSDYKQFAESKNNDYEDVQVQVDKTPVAASKQFSADKSREMAGEPDGSADPDGSAEAPALPSSPPPATTEPRLSFLHQNATPKPEKPAVPVKPTVSIIKAFVKRTPNTVEQQVISELQNHMLKNQSSAINKTNTDKPTLSIRQEADSPKGGMKKSRAPDPPSPTTSEEVDHSYQDVHNHKLNTVETEMFEINLNATEPKTAAGGQNSNMMQKSKTDDQYSFLYTRNPTGSVGKSTSPVIREKDKRERATINPKFRSLNTFSTQYKNQQAEKLRSITPEPAPRKSLSMSQDCLMADDKKKTKTKFSIKKFLRISTNKTSDPIYDKKDGIYGKRTPTDEEQPQVKPRLVIIHPIDINNMEVEVVKEMGKVSEIITGKPPAPPLRKGLDLSKPIRPPPPKSAEVRKKLKLGISDSKAPASPKASKEDNVYANLGEIRSAIAPRKPERTASMREREVQLEMARKRLSKLNNDDDDIDFSPIPSSASSASTLERYDSGASSTKKVLATSEASPKFSTRLELFEKNAELAKPQKASSLFTDGIKSSIQKMNNTIDSYLKDRMVSEVDTPHASTIVVVQQPTKLPQPAPPVRSSTVQTISSTLVASAVPAVVVASAAVRTSEIELRTNYEPILVNTQRSSLPDNSMNLYGGNESPAMLRSSGYCKSDIGATRFRNQSLANIERAVSRSYCGSEISEFDVYSAYSFYGGGGSEAGGGGNDVGQGDLHDGWNGVQQPKNRPTNRLRMRKGRSVVHKNLEDNYGAVVVANHEALAQVLDQLQKTTTISPLLRPLANSINLRFDDFAILEGVRGVVAGRRAFHPAIWANQTHVTLALSVDCNQMTDLQPITEFCDLVPNHYLPLMPNPEMRMVQATISVMPRMFVDTLQSFGQMLRIRSENLKNHAFSGSTLNLADALPKPSHNVLRTGQSVQNLSTFHDEPNDADADATVPQIPGMPSYDELVCREVGFVLLQLVNGLKSLQAKGIEELPLSLSNVILCKELENKEAQAKLCVLHGLNQDLAREDEEPMGTLCQCAHAALTTMLPHTKLTATLTQILLKDRSESLSRTKSTLEFALWGPSDVALNGSLKEREMALQRWLDLERATILHGLVRSRVELSVYDECHLMFLVRSSAKTMCEASSVLGGCTDVAE